MRQSRQIVALILLPPVLLLTMIARRSLPPVLLLLFVVVVLLLLLLLQGRVRVMLRRHGDIIQPVPQLLRILHPKSWQPNALRPREVIVLDLLMHIRGDPGHNGGLLYPGGTVPGAIESGRLRRLIYQGHRLGTELIP